MVVKGKVRMGGGMEDGTLQGSIHSTKDLLVAGDLIIRRTRHELEIRSLRHSISSFADDLTLWDPH